MQRKFAAFAATTVLTFSVASARADDTGVAGSIVGLQRNTTSADTYLQFHGRMLVKNLNGVVDEYRWGGTSCGSRVLTEGEFAGLQAAQNNKKMLVQPLSQLGQGNVLCLVGFSTAEKKNLALLP